MKLADFRYWHKADMPLTPVICPLSGVKQTFSQLTSMSLLTQSGHFDAGPTSNSITAGFTFIVAREIIHLRPTAFPSRENDYVRTIFISYPAQHHRSRTRRVSSVALRTAGRRD